MLDGIRNAVGSTLTYLGRKIAGRPLSETPGVLWSSSCVASSGVHVDADTALSLSAVFAACSLLSRVIGSLPLQVYEQWGRSKEKATTHPAYRLLHSSPNPEMTAATFKRTMEWNRLLHGAAYAEITWAGNGKPVALWPVEAWRVKPDRRDDGSLYYQIDQQREVEPDDMLAVPLISSDGVCGRGWIDYAVESLGLGIATQEFAARYFGNNAEPGGILVNPGATQPKQRQELRESWEERHKGPHKSHRTGILWGGWTYTPSGASNAENAQLIEQRRFTTEEVARWLGVPPHLLRDLNRATFSNIEQQNLDFLVYSLGPILTDYEQEYDKKLLRPPDLYSKHSVNGLLRGDQAARSAWYREMINAGVMSVNECRDLEDMNPVDGGDVHFFPLAMAPLPTVAFPVPVVQESPPTTTPALPAPVPAPAPEPTPSPVLAALLESTLERLARVEANAIRRAAEKPRRFLSWLDEYYPEHERRLREALTPVLPVCVPSGTSAEKLASVWCEDSKERLLFVSGDFTLANFTEGVAGLLASAGWSERAQNATRALIGERHAEANA